MRIDLAEPTTRPDSCGVLLTFAAACPPANVVFTPDELEQRLKRLRVRMLPRFRRFVPAHCWSCGKRLPGCKPSKWGWAARPLRTHPSESEMYCHFCFEKWGWDW